MDQIAVIADDLTGASDSGVQFSRKGLRTQVVFDWTCLPQRIHDLNAVVIDTDSRAMSGEAAYEVVKRAAEQLKSKGYASVYKKLDSTLRGNLGQEIDAVMDAYKFEAAFIAPAYPKNGRTTVQGIHYLQGIPVNQTEIARDPRAPVHEAELSRIFAMQSGRSSVSIHLPLLRQGTEAVRRFIQTALERDTRLVLFDAETDEDMRGIARIVSTFDNRYLLAGSAGLADHLELAGRWRPEPGPSAFSISQAIMLVAGSLSAVTREQVLEVNRQPDTAAVEMNSSDILASEERREREIGRCLKAVLGNLAKGKDISLYPGSSSERMLAANALGSGPGLSQSEHSARIANALGDIASQAAASFQLRGVVLTGGDTAKSVIRRLGAYGFELIDEVEPGIPFGRLIGGGGLMAVTKAGAFGTKQSLCQAVEFLKKGDLYP
jgi:uncharacterized protein YgbK (DUF1537 family)